MKNIFKQLGLSKNCLTQNDRAKILVDETKATYDRYHVC